MLDVTYVRGQSLRTQIDDCVRAQRIPYDIAQMLLRQPPQCASRRVIRHGDVDLCAQQLVDRYEAEFSMGPHALKAVSATYNDLEAYHLALMQAFNRPH